MPTIEHTDSAALKRALEDIRTHIGKIQHDLNNPLSVVSGNTELLLELSKALGVSDDFQPPLKDMEKALEKLTEQVDRLMVIRTLLTRLSENLDG